MMYYQKHIFLCVNQKKEGKKCCADGGGIEIFHHLKNRLQSLGLFGKNQIRVTHSGCLGRCSLGPCLVIYPDNIWYRYNSLDDIDAIIDEHLAGHKVVERLFIDHN